MAIYDQCRCGSRKQNTSEVCIKCHRKALASGPKKVVQQVGWMEIELRDALKAHAANQGLSWTEWATLALVDKMNAERREEKRRREKGKR